MSIPWIILELIVNLFQGAMFTWFLWSTLESKYNGMKNLTSALLCTFSYFIAVTMANYITFFESMGIFSYAAIFFVFSLLFLCGSVLKKLLISVIAVSSLAMTAAFSINFISLIFGRDTVFLMSEASVYRICVFLFSNLLLFFLLYFAKTIFVKNNISLTKKEWVFMALILSFSITIFALLFFTLFAGISEIGKIYLTFAITLIIFIDMLVYFLLVQLSKKYKIELENKLLLQQQSFQAEASIEIKKQYDALQKMRHDFNNNLRVIQSLNQDHKNEQIKEYIDSFLDSPAQIPNIVSTNNSYVNAIINTKLSQASSKGIQSNVSVISDIQCDYNIDLCSILGNMFDNAIEACIKCTGEKFIVLSISKNEQILTLTMKNSIASPVLKHNPTLMTTKEDHFLHGHGTRIIKDLAVKYHGSVDFYEKDNVFCCNVVLIF